MLFFSIYDEKQRSYRGKKPFPNSGVTRRLWTLGRLELTLVVNTMLLTDSCWHSCVVRTIYYKVQER